MRLNPNDLITFAHVARTGTLTAAGSELSKTQPAISAQVRQLSDVVGMPVVARHRHGVTLTSAGETLLPYAQAITRALDGATQVIERLRGLEVGRLTVFASTSLAVYLLPSVLAAFHARYPAIDLRLVCHNAGDALRALERGDCDVAVVRGLPLARLEQHSGHFVRRTLFRDETVLVASPDHPLAKRRSITMRELGSVEIISREPTSATRALIEQLAAEAGVTLRYAFQTIGVEALKEAVLQGLGAGFLSRLAIERETARKTLVAIRVPSAELMHQVVLAHPMADQCAPAVSAFVGLLSASLSKTPRAARRR
jgi:DNA-binding transcriptional LysR family regulator